jgi:hypothetical protein
MTTGKDWHGNTAYGPAGGNVAAYGMRDAASLARAGMGPMAGSFGNFRTPSGAAMFGGSPVQGQSFTGMNMGQAMSQAMRAQAALEAAKAAQGGLLAPARGPAPSAPYDENVLAVEDVPPVPNPLDPMAIYTTLTPPPATWNPTTALPSVLPNTNYARFTGQNFLNTWNARERARQQNAAPDPLANDMSRFNKPNGAPLNIGGIQGGMGSPGYSNPGTPGFGGRR